MSTTIQRMEAAGLVERRHDDEDQRVSRVYLTRKGRSVREDVEQVWDRIEEEVFVDFTPEELMLLRRLFLQMRENLVRATQLRRRH